MQHKKWFNIAGFILLLFIGSLFLKTSIGLKLLQGFAVCLIASINYYAGGLFNKGLVKEDFIQGDEYTFLYFEPETKNVEWDHLMYFFAQDYKGSKLYCCGYFYPKFPQKGGAIIVGQSPDKYPTKNAIFMVKD